MLNGSKTNITVLGGGFGGLEAAFYLRMKLEDRANITLVSDRDYFLFKPNTIYIPFGLDPDKLKVGLQRPTRRKNIAFVEDRAREIDPDARTVSTEGGRKIPHDFLVVATGADMRPEEVPGLKENAQTIWTPREMLRLRLALYDLIEAARRGEHKRVLFLVAPNNKCAGPLYELVFMLDTHLRRKKVRANVDLTWSTYEQTYIQAFGPRLHEVVTGEFERRVVAGHTEYAAEKVESGEVHYTNGETLPYDLLITFSPYVAEVDYPTLPGDDRGFVETELGTRQVVGHPDVYAVGDAGNFPVKQAFLAFLQADAAAEHISSRVLGVEPELAFEPTSMCVMEQFDKATFAQVPLRLTGVPERPIEVDPDAPEAYKVGSYPAWRLGKKMLAYYLPFRFGLGNPFHAGVPWKGMEAGLKAMSGLLAK
ncbi:NAD(P)/FAD-dependent oxidoreductase [Rubrobacter tropicus]|uniref:NAD(P)/FAD-dependent oxidoreductase n=1 Tax=Rubrobacter tropicus TaxID=2653851 RepID=A0A6G8QEB2_9ACTN|nr:FAD-dependent oxidoreductase [Rubrobacter tropicus]QIN84741.1 NAD(P)/FAD-dependent oxidoreductase [Rubrobacter tropicus]